jgi:hypothetical protein
MPWVMYILSLIAKCGIGNPITGYLIVKKNDWLRKQRELYENPPEQSTKKLPLCSNVSPVF